MIKFAMLMPRTEAEGIQMGHENIFDHYETKIITNVGAPIFINVYKLEKVEKKQISATTSRISFNAVQLKFTFRILSQLSAVI